MINFGIYILFFLQCLTLGISQSFAVFVVSVSLFACIAFGAAVIAVVIERPGDPLAAAGERIGGVQLSQ